jgi:Phage tail tube protein
MTLRDNIDSNETSLNYAEETRLGVLPVTPIWYPAEPNSYSNFGGSLKLLARNPINRSRQRKKGVITDLDAKGGYNQDFTQSNFQNLLQGLMFADFRQKPTLAPTSVSGTAYVAASITGWAAGALALATGFATPANNGLKVVTGVTGSTDVQVSGLVAEASPPAGAKVVMVGFNTAAGVLDVTATGLPVITGVPAAFAALVIPGEWVYIGGDGALNEFTNDGNNGFKRISAIATTNWTIDLSQSAMVAETNTAQTVQVFFGRVLKNELNSLIKYRSYQFERQLGNPDDANTSAIQSEYLIGSMIDQYDLNVKMADKITADVTLLSMDNQQRTATDGVKSGTRATLVESDAFNTSTDFAMLRMNIIDPTNADPDPLFAYLSDLKLTFKNNLKVNKAIGVLGGFSVSAGTFEVSATATAYFSTIEAVQAVRLNRDCEVNAAVVKENAGFVIDLPLIALGGGELDVKQDEAISLPLTIDAATAAKINPNTDYTAMWVFFDYLPNAASPE